MFSTQIKTFIFDQESSSMQKFYVRYNTTRKSYKTGPYVMKDLNSISNILLLTSPPVKAKVPRTKIKATTTSLICEI